MFWELETLVPCGNNSVFRNILGWMMPPKDPILKLAQGKSMKEIYESVHVTQVPLTLNICSLLIAYEGPDVAHVRTQDCH